MADASQSPDADLGGRVSAAAAETSLPAIAPAPIPPRWLDYFTAVRHLPPWLRKVIVLIVGGLTLLVGIVMIIAPGPAVVVVPLGLSILATEFSWARRWLDTLTHHSRSWWQYLLQPRAAGSHSPSAAASISPVDAVIGAKPPDSTIGPPNASLPVATTTEPPTSVGS